MCVIDPEWYWDTPTPTGWAAGMTTCCRPTRTPGEPGVLLIELHQPDWDLCPDCNNTRPHPTSNPHPLLSDQTIGNNADGDGDSDDGWIVHDTGTAVCRTCDGDGLVPAPDPVPAVEWMCEPCAEAARWLDEICHGDYLAGSNVIADQIHEHAEEGFGGPAGKALATAATSQWVGYSIATITSLTNSAIAHDHTTNRRST